MSAPVLSSTTTLTLRNVQETGGRYAVPVGTPAVVRFSVESSGVDSPYVKHRVDWGDGEFDISGDYLPTGRFFQYVHEYREVGEYTVVVRVTNMDGELSPVDSFAVLAVRIDPLTQQQVRPHKWRGLALPINNIGSALAAVEQSFPVEVLNLASQAPVGTRQIVLAAQSIGFAKDATITISQANRLITSARIVATDSNVAILDADLNDTYDPGQARVEVLRRDISRRFTTTTAKPVGWFFPVSVDENLVKSAVSMILATRPGERVFRSRIGSRIHELPFEQNDNITGAQARSYVPGEIEEQEPRAAVRRVLIDSPTSSELWIRTELELAVGPEATFNISVPLGGAAGAPTSTSI